ncbi:PAS domain S-box protein [bacterium]|nr:MAG: PAS domain S-box protein [bacterium]
MPLSVDPHLLLSALPKGSWIEGPDGRVLAGESSSAAARGHSIGGGAMVYILQNSQAEYREERYKNFIERSNEGIWRFEINPPIPTALPAEEQIRLAFERAILAEGNDALARMYGGEEASQLVGMPLAAFMDPEDAGNRAYLTSFIENGYSWENGESEETGLDGARKTFANNLIGVVEDGLFVRAWGVQRDVTEEKRNERLFRKIADATPDMLCIYDTWARRVDFVNERVRDILGWSPEEYIELTSGTEPKLVHPEDLKRVDGGLRARKAMDSGGTWQASYRLQHKRGGYRTLDFRMVPFEEGPDNRIIRILTIGRDLSALRSQGQDFRQVIEGMAQLVWSTKPNGDHDFFNSKWYDFVGFDPGETDGTEMWNRLLYPEDQGRAAEVWQRCLETGDPYEIEYRFRRYDGAYRWFLARALPIRDDDGRIVRWFGTCTDIHAQKETLENLARESGRLLLALETLGAGAWRYDLTTKTVEWSEEMYELQGMEPNGQDLAKASLDRMHPEDRLRFKELIRACSGGLRSFRLDVRVSLEERGERWMRIRGVAVDAANGLPESVVGLVQDVTEDKRNEEALERAVTERTKELESANRELEGFTYSVSHDLRAPLRSIIANSRMLLEDAPAGLTEEQLGMLDRQAVNAKRLGDLIDDLLKLSRIGRQEMRLEPVDMTGLAREVTDEISDREPGRLTFNLQEGMRAYGDHRLLRFVWLNLLENAAKFSPPGSIVHAGEDESGFFVRDEGIGFDPEYARKLFEPFERLVRDDEFPGTGIGLANVKRIVERHSGEVWAIGELGKGATFRFRLPEKA